MATSNDHPGLPFVQAKGYTKGRADGPPIWVVIHDMEASEYSGRAESTAAYFADPPDGRQVSSHYTVDDDSVIQCVDLDDIAWTVGNRPGNYRGINWELSGFASQVEGQWLDPFGVAMFHEMAPICVSDMKRFNIPNHWCTIADLQARRPGLTTHNDLRIAFGVTTHTDPGPNFPFDYLQQLLEQELDPKPQESDMPEYVIEVQADGFERLIATNGVSWWWVRDASQCLEVFDKSFPSKKVTTAQLIAGFGVDLESAVAPLTPAELDQVEEAARAGVDDALDGATVTTTIDTAETP